ncbi:MAG: hypothetical protein JNL38_11200 [Myxococcales bacterium]|nr:hypothetical protein [Myxococcales bacterium]
MSSRSKADPRSDRSATMPPPSQRVRESGATSTRDPRLVALTDRVAALEARLDREAQLRADAEEEANLLRSELERIKKLATKSVPDQVKALELELARERDARHDAEEAYRRAREALGAGKTQHSTPAAPPRRATKMMLTPADEASGTEKRKTQRPPSR